MVNDDTRRIVACILVGDFQGNFLINKDEVNDLRWVDIDWLCDDMVKNPQNYASWFLICCPKVVEYIKSLY